MEKHRYIGKTKDDAINKAKQELQEIEQNLIIREIKQEKSGLFKSAKIEIEVIEQRDVFVYIKEYLINILKKMGFKATVDYYVKEDIPIYDIYADNNALLIGKNGKNLKALTYIVSSHIYKEIGKSFKFIIDVNKYNEKREESLKRLAKKMAREVASTNIEVHLNYMNSYERRIIHQFLSNDSKVYTESIGEEPHRYIVIKPR